MRVNLVPIKTPNEIMKEIETSNLISVDGKPVRLIHGIKFYDMSVVSHTIDGDINTYELEWKIQYDEC